MVIFVCAHPKQDFGDDETGHPKSILQIKHVLALIKSLFMHANLQLMAFACAHAAFDEHQEESMNRDTSDLQVSVSAGPVASTYSILYVTSSFSAE
jgi:hypothetical protein